RTATASRAKSAAGAGTARRRATAARSIERIAGCPRKAGAAVTVPTSRPAARIGRPPSLLLCGLAERVLGDTDDVAVRILLRLLEHRQRLRRTVVRPVQHVHRLEPDPLVRVRRPAAQRRQG